MQHGEPNLNEDLMWAIGRTIAGFAGAED